MFYATLITIVFIYFFKFGIIVMLTSLWFWIIVKYDAVYTKNFENIIKFINSNSSLNSTPSSPIRGYPQRWDGPFNYVINIQFLANKYYY